MKINYQSSIAFKSNIEKPDSEDNFEVKNLQSRPKIDMHNLTDFYSKEYREALDRATKYYESYKKSQMAKEASKTFEQVVPACDSIVKTALAEGSIATKAIAGSTSYLDNFIIISTNKAYDKAIDKSIQKSTRVRNFSDKHPSTAFAINLLSGVALTKLVMMGYERLKNYGSKKCPILANLNTGMENIIKKIPGSEFIENNILKKIAKWVQKNPKLSLTVAFGIDIFLVGTVIKNIYDINQLKRNNAEHFDEAANVRYEAARGVVGQLFYFTFIQDFIKANPPEKLAKKAKKLHK